jgi:hypothetical protein
MTVVRFVEFDAEDDPFMEASPPGLVVYGPSRASTNKKADEPPGPAGLPFIQSSDDI